MDSLIVASDDCLRGGGEAGALMRSIDWSSTPLGPVELWPPSLRTIVAVMLSSRFAMRVLWGPEFIVLYNDAYRPILGKTKHPAAMGSPAASIFAEVWELVGPVFQRVRRGDAVAFDDALLPLDRNGYLEDCYFTVSYSPIRDEYGSVGGVLGVVHETTDRVLAERRLATLRDLAGCSTPDATPRRPAARRPWRSNATGPTCPPPCSIGSTKTGGARGGSTRPASTTTGSRPLRASTSTRRRSPRGPSAGPPAQAAAWSSATSPAAPASSPQAAPWCCRSPARDERKPSDSLSPGSIPASPSTIATGASSSWPESASRPPSPQPSPARRSGARRRPPRRSRRSSPSSRPRWRRRCW
ncbi:MAG: PAS domain-containing protein [Deltaproteobacteria bacterium]|nr:PAS domain-containing protein [Deltaproteobacteria bacterium]